MRNSLELLGLLFIDLNRNYQIFSILPYLGHFSVGYLLPFSSLAELGSSVNLLERAFAIGEVEILLSVRILCDTI